MKNGCALCGVQNVLLRDGTCINGTRCEKRRMEQWRRQRELLEKAELLMIARGEREAAEAIEKVLKKGRQGNDWGMSRDN